MHRFSVFRFSVLALLLSSVATIGILAGSIARAAAPIIYPANGQDSAQQQKDEGECFVWARNESGFDPTTQTTVQAPQTQQAQGGAIKGAAGGAAIGAIVGDSDDAAKGAAIGAVVGRSRQNRRNQATAQKAQAQAASAQAAQDAGRQAYDRANAACLEGRGYTIR